MHCDTGGIPVSGSDAGTMPAPIYTPPPPNREDQSVDRTHARFCRRRQGCGYHTEPRPRTHLISRGMTTRQRALTSISTEGFDLHVLRGLYDREARRRTSDESHRIVSVVRFRSCHAVRVLAAPLNAADRGSNRTPALMQGMSVRRLTPTECERLQGFPDGYTLVPLPGQACRRRASLQGPWKLDGRSRHGVDRGADSNDGGDTAATSDNSLSWLASGRWPVGAIITPRHHARSTACHVWGTCSE
jgi:C-5 cytosine-specific DNA methylase